MVGKSYEGLTSSLGDIPPRSVAPASRHCSNNSSPSWSSKHTRFGGIWIATSLGTTSRASNTTCGRSRTSNFSVESFCQRSESPAEKGWRITSWMCPYFPATCPICCRASLLSSTVSPNPSSTPVVKGTPNSPAMLSCSSRSWGSFDGAHLCTVFMSRGDVCSTIRPIEALTSANRCISVRDSGPQLVWGRKPFSIASRHNSMMCWSHDSLFREFGCVSPDKMRISSGAFSANLLLSSSRVAEASSRLRRGLVPGSALKLQ
mmetsp:Transcript_28468/g.55408  ORF Transcript_28468/g.55408 Transcript_28468/m.55408 type:complete len:261 (-) Transcript_28468:313-1095(-)